MKKLKVLLIGGIHGSEERTRIIIMNFLNANSKIKDKFEIKAFPFVSNSLTREVSFNLNRMDQVKDLKELADTMTKLFNEIEYADIVLDIHNTPICSNKLLVSSNNLPDYKVSKKKYQNMVIWRPSDFKSISEFAREKGKIAFTVEFGGMVANSTKTKKETKFLLKTLKLCSEIRSYQHYKAHTVVEETWHKDLFVESNRLVEVELDKPMVLVGGKVIPGQLVASVNSVWEPQIPEAGFEAYEFEVVSPESNYSKIFEGCIKIKKEER